MRSPHPLRMAVQYAAGSVGDFPEPTGKKRGVAAAAEGSDRDTDAIGWPQTCRAAAVLSEALGKSEEASCTALESFSVYKLQLGSKGEIPSGGRLVAGAEG